MSWNDCDLFIRHTFTGTEHFGWELIVLIVVAGMMLVLCLFPYEHDDQLDTLTAHVGHSSPEKTPHRRTMCVLLVASMLIGFPIGYSVSSRYANIVAQSPEFHHAMILGKFDSTHQTRFYQKFWLSGEDPFSPEFARRRRIHRLRRRGVQVADDANLDPRSPLVEQLERAARNNGRIANARLQVLPTQSLDSDRFPTVAERIGAWREFFHRSLLLDIPKSMWPDELSDQPPPKNEAPTH